MNNEWSMGWRVSLFPQTSTRTPLFVKMSFEGEGEAHRSDDHCLSGHWMSTPSSQIANLATPVLVWCLWKYKPVQVVLRRPPLPLIPLWHSLWLALPRDGILSSSPLSCAFCVVLLSGATEISSWVLISLGAVGECRCPRRKQGLIGTH